jgi:hypothetical protein
VRRPEGDCERALRTGVVTLLLTLASWAVDRSDEDGLAEKDCSKGLGSRSKLDLPESDRWSLASEAGGGSEEARTRGAAARINLQAHWGSATTDCGCHRPAPA